MQINERKNSFSFAFETRSKLAGTIIKAVEKRENANGNNSNN